MNRRGFFRFLVAAPVAIATAPLVAAKPKTDVFDELATELRYEFDKHHHGNPLFDAMQELRRAEERALFGPPPTRFTGLLHRIQPTVEMP